MRKLLIVLGLAVALTVVFAPAAFADNPYAAWDPNQAGNVVSSPNIPHGGYGLTTEKCDVCHAVHGAGFKIYDTNGNVIDSAWAGDTSASPVLASSVPTSQLLLRGAVADACEYCHVDTNIGGTALYQANTNILYYGNPAGAPAVLNPHYVTNPLDTKNSGHVTCVQCHSVHGAQTIGSAQYGPGGVAQPISRVILKTGNGVWGDGRNYQQDLTAAYATQGATAYIDGGTDYDLSVSGFCTRCHKNFSSSPDNVMTMTSGRFAFTDWGSSTTIGGTNPGQVATYQSHAMTAAASTFNRSGANFNGQVAFSGSQYCTDCHRAGQIYVGPHNSTTGQGTAYVNPSQSVDGVPAGTTVPVTLSSSLSGSNKGTTLGNIGYFISDFPHYTPNNAYFLTAATSLADVETGVALGDEGTDGVCLRCHRDGSNHGLGLTF